MRNIFANATDPRIYENHLNILPSENALNCEKLAKNIEASDHSKREHSTNGRYIDFRLEFAITAMACNHYYYHYQIEF